VAAEPNWSDVAEAIRLGELRVTDQMAAYITGRCVGEDHVKAAARARARGFMRDKLRDKLVAGYALLEQKRAERVVTA
jgi:hypothetical protein